MSSISQRDLRNDNAQIMDGVEQGETYTVTRRGVPIARLVPITGGGGLRLVRPAKRRGQFARLQRVRSAVPTARLLDDLRGDR